MKSIRESVIRIAKMCAIFSLTDYLLSWKYNYELIESVGNYLGIPPIVIMMTSTTFMITGGFLVYLELRYEYRNDETRKILDYSNEIINSPRK